MIYVLCPSAGQGGFRILANYGLMEQVVWSKPGNWCVVYGLELGIDEYNLVWIYQQGPNGTLIRSPAKS